MIKELELCNWKSFENAKLYIDPLSFLIGTNASGKSNVVDAFAFLSKLSSGKTVNLAVHGENEINPLRGGAHWLIRRGQRDGSCDCF